MNKYHLQGFTQSNIYIGSYYEGLLVGVMLFKKDDESSFEITRFCVNDVRYYNLTYETCLKFFIKHYDFSRLYYFADRRWLLNSKNNIYSKIGFKIDSIFPPQYTYVIGNKRSLEYIKGAYKIYDCGYVKYIYAK